MRIADMRGLDMNKQSRWRRHAQRPVLCGWQALCRPKPPSTGVTGTSFNLIARAGYVSTPDGGSLYSWGYA